MTMEINNGKDDSDCGFFKKQKNRNKYQIIEIDNEPCKILGYRKKHWKTIYQEGYYIEICPIDRMENKNKEINITIVENGYKQKFICTQFRKWDNYNSFFIQKEWIEND